jgi:hypothetical protein
MVSLKSNTRYSWSIRQRFRFLNLDTSITGSFVDLFNVDKILRLKVTDQTSLEISLFNMNGALNGTHKITLTNPIGQKWHEVSASLFNFTWTLNFDGQELI